MINESVQRDYGRISPLGILRQLVRHRSISAQKQVKVPADAPPKPLEEQLACFQYIGNIFKR